MVKPRYDTTMGGSDDKFPLTEWTQLLDPFQKEAIIAELCMRYWKPLYSYLRSSGFDNDAAKDLVQSFLTEKVIDQELIRQADRTRGRLRAFLLTALRHHAINAGRSPKAPVIFRGPVADGVAADSPEAVYDRAWADQLLRDVLAQLRIECRERGKTVHWRLFHEWLLEPRVDQQRPQMKDLCDKHGIESTAQAYHMIENIKRRFRSILKDHLEVLVDSDGDVEAEIRNFISIFEKGAAR